MEFARRFGRIQFTPFAKHGVMQPCPRCKNPTRGTPIGPHCFKCQRIIQAERGVVEAPKKVQYVDDPQEVVVKALEVMKQVDEALPPDCKMCQDTGYLPCGRCEGSQIDPEDSQFPHWPAPCRTCNNGRHACGYCVAGLEWYRTQYPEDPVKDIDEWRQRHLTGGDKIEAELLKSFLKGRRENDIRTPDVRVIERFNERRKE